jgi:hypothetical protein
MTSSEVVEKVPAPERAQVDAMITQQLAWLSNGGGDVATKEQLDGQKESIQKALAPLLGKLYATTGELPGQEDAKSATDLTGIQGGETAAPSSVVAAPPPTQLPLLTSLGPPYNQAAPAKEGALVFAPPPAVATNVAAIGPSIIY